MSAHTITVHAQGLDWSVEVDYQPAEGDGWHSPRIPESYTLDGSICLAGDSRDLTDYLSAQTLDAIEQAVEEYQPRRAADDREDDPRLEDRGSRRADYVAQGPA